MPSLRSSRVVLPEGTRPASVRWDGGTVVEVGDFPADHDFGDLVVMPGLVDSHVHVNDPGRADWEGFATATRSAAAGGTTTIVDMPLNSIPPTVSTGALEEKRRAARGNLAVDVAFWGGLIPGSEPELEPLAAEGVCGFKSFLVDSGVDEFPPMSLDALALALPTLARLGVPSLVHAEDPGRLLPFTGRPTSYASYLASRPPDAEGEAIEALAGLARSTGASVHVLHVSSEEAVDRLASGPSQLSGETCPHYLIFSAEEVPDGATPFKCAPPIRESGHREALWQALADGVLAMVVSDHSPAPAGIKALDTGDFSRAWGGIGSLQLRLQATWTGAWRRGMSLEQLTTWLCSGPALLAGLHPLKGSIEVGSDADFVVWDPDGATEVRADRLLHRHPITPYDGMRLRGEVTMTWLRGEAVFTGGTVRGGHGKMLRRWT